jgi:3-hydroxyisobutyrate dehydrogenase
MAKIAFLGLGAMGARMASHLIAAGHELIVWNRNAAKATALVQKGARSASSPRQAAQGAEIVLPCCAMTPRRAMYGSTRRMEH